MKHCPYCENDYPATTEYFYQYPASPDGLAHACIECKKAYARDYRKSTQGQTTTKLYRSKPEIQKRRKEYQKEYMKGYQRKKKDM